MFNNNKKDKESMNSNKSDNNLPSVNMISEGTKLKGTLTTKNDVRIAGTLDGEAEAEGKIIVSSTGRVDGNIEAVDADIAGNIDGEVRVSNKLIFRKSATIEGDIYTKTILAEEGSQINGSFHMGENVKEEINKSSKRSSSKLGSSISKDDNSENSANKEKSKAKKD